MIQENLVEWFKVALQWDPKKRGKLEDSNEIVLFDLLKRILSKQVGLKKCSITYRSFHSLQNYTLILLIIIFISTAIRITIFIIVVAVV